MNTEKRKNTERQELLGKVVHAFPWAKQFGNKLAELPTAAEAFDVLIQKGCDVHDLLHWLEIACGNNFQQSAASDRELADKLLDVAGQTLKASEALQKLAGSHRYGEQFISLQPPDFRSMTSNMREYADFLLQQAVQLQSGTNTREAPRLAVAWLAARVSGSTRKGKSTSHWRHKSEDKKERCYYKEIAALMEAVYSTKGIDKDVSDEGIKKQVERFRQKHQYAYSHMVNMARRQFGDLKEEYISGDGITDSDLENVNPVVAPIGYAGYKSRQARRRKA